MGLCRNGPDLLARILRHAMCQLSKWQEISNVSAPNPLLATRLRAGLKVGGCYL